ncbi:MAG: L,D-transpeptidase family protein [Pseudonocardiaceae bacterium]
MSRRAIIISRALVMFATSIGVAAGLRTHTPDVALQDLSKLEDLPEPFLDVPHVDPEPNLPPPPAPVPPPPAPPPGPDVGAAQQRLAELSYYVSSVDGKAGGSTRSAVMAFQKVNGLKADGAIGPQTSAALASAAKPSLRGGPPNRIEVDLTRQVLYFVQNNDLVRVIPVSSGNGKVYRTPSGGRARANTPVGTFRVNRRIRGVRVADLGTLYNPMYFYGGYAIHGSTSVPNYPASHGCIRVSQADAVWLFARTPVGTTVMVYGGTHTFSP